MVKIPNRRQFHNASLSQLLSWLIFKISPQRRTQEKRVLIYLSDKAANSRQLSTDLKIDRTSMTRTLRDLEDYGLVKVESIRKCPTTHRLTQFYTLSNDASANDLDKQAIGKQGDLFNDLKTDEQ
jgi:predicted ArsR family transcriptional regulator